MRHRRMLAHVIEDSASIFQQDASEYAFAGLIGAFAACITTLVLVSVGGTVGALLLPPFLIAIAVVTLATATEALRRVTDNLEPSAAAASAAVLRGLPAVLLPWAPLALALAAALVLDVRIGHWLAPSARGLIESLVVVAALYAALGRVLAVPSLVMRRSTAREATQEGRALAARALPKVAGAWGICLSPALLVFLVPALSGFGAVSSAIAALAFVGSMPFAAIVNALLFFDAVADGATAAGTQATMARRTAGLRQVR
ncbi:MAG: hypothetical protein KGK07_08820 [Chloroflexota bacterium]|nr:hypothetical protein [Chloroflexota bacterium]